MDRKSYSPKIMKYRDSYPNELKLDVLASCREENNKASLVISCCSQTVLVAV